MADRLTGGRLAALIVQYREAGSSWDDISRRLYSEFDVEVSAETLQAWGKALAEDAAPDDDEPAAVNG
ncbi:MAG: hypothetical protein QOD63_847 [Actinomycetota bacterium]|jgi:hypothetical protein|nr:hypothetical protein [Actinomycetota bacterium]